MSRELIVQEFRQIGLAPALKGGYLQQFTTTITQPDGKSQGNPKNPSLGTRARTSNVMGLLPGNDPKLAKEVIIVSAHHDHLGQTPHGVPYPGANDDATGVAATLELARAFAQLKGNNKRTLLFVAYGAEEQEEMGSMYHVENPLPAVPNKNIIMMLSIDMIGRGFNAWTAMPQKELDQYSNRWFKEVYNGNSVDADDYSHKYGLVNSATYSFDTGPFARVGINNRVFGRADVGHYHKTSDTWDNVQFDSAVVVTRTIFDFLWKMDQDPRVHVGF